MKNITRYKRYNDGKSLLITLDGFKKAFNKDALNAVNECFVALKEREKNPSGYFDKAGRFYLHDDLISLSTAREPSRAYPYSQMNEARTRKFLLKVWVHRDIKTKEELEKIIYS